MLLSLKTTFGASGPQEDKTKGGPNFTFNCHGEKFHHQKTLTFAKQASSTTDQMFFQKYVKEDM